MTASGCCSIPLLGMNLSPIVLPLQCDYFHWLCCCYLTGTSWLRVCTEGAATLLFLQAAAFDLLYFRQLPARMLPMCPSPCVELQAPEACLWSACRRSKKQRQLLSWSKASGLVVCCISLHILHICMHIWPSFCMTLYTLAYACACLSGTISGMHAPPAYCILLHERLRQFDVQCPCVVRARGEAPHA